MNPLKKRLLEGATYEEIANEFHVGKQTISYEVLQLNEEEKKIREIAKHGKPKIPKTKNTNTNTNTTTNTNKEYSVLVLQEILFNRDVLVKWNEIKSYFDNNKTFQRFAQKRILYIIRELDELLSSLPLTVEDF